MSDEELFEEEEGEIGGEEDTALASIRQKIKRRCSEAGIECEEKADPELFGGKILVMLMPAGREKRRIPIFDSEQAETLLSSGFEKYRFLADYEAICSYEGGFIEASIRGPFPLSRLSRLLFGPTQREGERKDQAFVITIEPPEGDRYLQIEIGPSSDAFIGLLRQRGPTIKIRGLPITQHDEAVEYLEKLADPIFFQIDLLWDTPFQLSRTRKRLFRRRIAIPHEPSMPVLKFPKYVYDREPLALYFYARSAGGWPLLQYLAYYQVIEFYFIICSQNFFIK